jgi:hypothetical protein
MSQRALLLAVRDQLRLAAPDGVGLAPEECEVRPDGRPPPNVGERFVAVSPSYWRGEDIEGLSEELGCQVTVTVRAARVPDDRFGPYLLVGPTGKSLDELLEAIRAVLHLDRSADAVLNRANAIIGAGANGFVEPLRFREGGRPDEKRQDWFEGREGGRVPRDTIVAIVQTLTFGGARRVQTIESMT